MKCGIFVRGVWWAAILVVAVAHEPAFCAASLELGPVREEGAYLAVPVEFAPDTAVGTAGLQFDLQYDTSQFDIASVTAGFAATQGDKGVMWSEPVPGTLRVLVAGMNQTVMPPGTLVSVHFVPTVAGHAPAPCAFATGVASGPFGEDVPLALPIPEAEEETLDDTPAKIGDETGHSTNDNPISFQEAVEEALSPRPSPGERRADSPLSSEPAAPGSRIGGFEASPGDSYDNAPGGGPGAGAGPARIARTARRGLLAAPSDHDENSMEGQRVAVTGIARAGGSGYGHQETPGPAPAPAGNSTSVAEAEISDERGPQFARVLDSGDLFGPPANDANHATVSGARRVADGARTASRLPHTAGALVILISALVAVFAIRRRFLEPRPAARRH